jgi:hypothetical protein
MSVIESSQEWAAEVAAKADIDDVDAVRRILDDEDIPGGRVLPSRRKLHLDAVHFAGVKSLARPDDGTGPGQAFSPFSFTQRFENPVTAFATLGKNDAGKSTIINMIQWGIRGISTGLQADVRSWTRQAAVAFHVDSEPMLVGWRVDRGVPVGQILTLPAGEAISWASVDEEGRRYAEKETAASSELGATERGDQPLPTAIEIQMQRLVDDGAIVVGTFTDETSFEAAINSVMTSRLGFEPLRAWQKNKGATDISDGGIAVHDWSLWSQALIISDSKNSSTLGETPMMAGRVLQMYLGTAWGPSASAAAARKAQLEGELASLKRRQRADQQTRQGSISELEGRIRELEGELAQLPSQDSLEAIDRALGEARAAATAYANANAEVAERARAYGTAGLDLQSAEADELALAEAAVTRRFWHSLEPSCCPRCDAVVDETRMKREQSGHCSLCDSPVELDSTGAGEAAQSQNVAVAVDVSDAPQPNTEEDPDDLLLAHQRVEWLREQFELASTEHDRATKAREAAQEELDRTRALVTGPQSDPAARRAVEFQIENLRGRLEERTTIVVPADDLSVQQRTIDVLGAAEVIAKNRRQDEQSTMLAEVSERVTEIARRLGISQLEKAELKGNAHLPVVKGGAAANFGQLTDGERLRLKIAVVVALLHVGTAAGVGRHPGVLIIDSFLREELNPDDATGLLKELVDVATDYGLQVITSSANGDVLAASLPIGSVRLAGPDGMMW